MGEDVVVVAWVSVTDVSDSFVPDGPRPRPMEGKTVSPGSSSVVLGELVAEPLVTLLVPVCEEPEDSDDDDGDGDGEPNPNPSVKLEIKLPSPPPEPLSDAVELKSSGALSVRVCGGELVIVWFVHWRLIDLG